MPITIIKENLSLLFKNFLGFFGRCAGVKSLLWLRHGRFVLVFLALVVVSCGVPYRPSNDISPTATIFPFATPKQSSTLAASPSLTPTLSPTVQVSQTTTPKPTETPQSELSFQGHTIFFEISGEKFTEIWQVVDGSQSELIYQIPRHITLQEGEQNGLISTETSSSLREYFAGNPTDNIVNADSIPLDTFISTLALSPSKEYLTWLEEYVWRPGNFILGQTSIKILHIENGTVVAEISSPEALLSPVWSPDSRYISFQEVARRNVNDERSMLIWLFDVSTQERTMIGYGLHPAWAPDGQSVMVSHLPVPGNLSNIGINLISLDGEVSTLVPETWGRTTHPDWCSDGIRIVFVNRKESDDDSHIYIIDEPTREISTLQSEVGNSGKIRWSFNCNWIAMETGFPEKKLVVLDASTGEAVTWVSTSTENVGDWSWSADENQILYVSFDVSGNPRTQQIKIISIPDGKTATLEFPDAIQEIFQNPIIYDIPGISITW